MNNPSDDKQDPRERFRRLIASESETQAEPVKATPENLTPDSGIRDTPHPAVDSRGMPLPRRVDEIDIHATRVTPAAFDHTPTGKNRPSPTVRRPSATVRRPPFNWRKAGGCLLHALILVIYAADALALILAAIGFYQYYTIAASLPIVEDLRAGASEFETTRILDRNANILYEILDPNAGRRTYISLAKISPYLVAATIATEDKDFYAHPGYDPIAILRALWNNALSGGEGGGASTITQQLARTLLLSPQERSQRTFMRKTREIILAAEITRRYSKDDILELYL
ncbi:MAG: biosynthetic peptidoglycan transglycosylase, partial [Anaerolineales bacterium]|nr:biosynthetic peptidoglycan transglycosylase [Anaerolineales bacterium]